MIVLSFSFQNIALKRFEAGRERQPASSTDRSNQKT